MMKMTTIATWAAAGMFLVFSAGALAEMDDPTGYVLLVQQSPADAGSLNPGTGVHRVGIGQTVSLQATPRPGYRFLYWLGDVSATASADTTVSLDSPKMVVAVFERESFEEELPLAGLATGLAGPGGLHGSNPMTPPGSVSPAGGGGGGFGGGGNGGGNGGVPVPGGNGGVPVPGDFEEVPEPATLLLLGVGAAALLRKRK